MLKRKVELAVSAALAEEIENPVGTDGFEFVEYAAEDPDQLADLFIKMGFQIRARHRSKDVLLFRQGEINFILNREPDSFSQSFARRHGPSICAIALRVRDAGRALKRAVELGAREVSSPAGPMELNIPVIEGVGGSLLYLVDRYGEHSIYDVDFVQENSVVDQGYGLSYIDHLTHNVHRGRMDHWASFYERLFAFREVRNFQIRGQMTGLRSRAMTSPCGKIRIPINESEDDQSQIEEYLRAYSGEGIQHVALGTKDIYETVGRMQEAGIRFLTTPDSYYDMLAGRLPDHGEETSRLRGLGVLLDGDTRTGDEPRLLLQVFTENAIGPIFFEVIQRKGDEGFGEGNFQALFEAMERDQMARGVLKAGEEGE